MKNVRAIFWLFFVTAAAVAAHAFLSWRTPTVRLAKRTTLLDPAFVPTSLAIERRASPRIVLEKRGVWRLVQPYGGSVDAQVLLRLLDRLAVTPVANSRTDAELLKLGQSRAALGLSEPAVSLTLADGKDEVSLAFGDFTPSSNGVYVALAGSDTVFIVPPSIRAAADLDAAAFRERDVFPYEPEFVADFDLRRAGESPVGFTRAEGGWKVGGAAASSAKVRDFLSRLAGTSAIDFIWPVGATNEETTVSEARLVGYGLDAGAALSVTLRCRDGVDRRILIGADEGKDRAYALIHDGGAIVTVDSSLKAAALDGTHAFVDARLFPLEESSVSAFTLTEGEISHVLARGEEGAWRLDSPIAAPADPKLANVLLGRLLALTPSDLAEDGVRVSVSTNREPCVVSKEALLGAARFEDLRSREILRVDAALVKRIVSTPGGRHPKPPVSVVHSREAKTWNVEGAEGDGTVDAEAVERLLAALSPLRAVRIVSLTASASDLAHYGLERPVHTVSIDQEKDGAVRRNVFIGAVTPGGRFATVGSAEAIFVLSDATVEALAASLLGD